MKAQRLLAGLFVTIVAALAALWVVRTTGGSDDSAAVAPGDLPGPRERGTTGPADLPLEAAGEDAPPETERRSDLSTEELAATVDDESGTIELDGARWIEVQVRVPQGTPADESLQVVGMAADEEHLSALGRLTGEIGSRHGWGQMRETLIQQDDIVWTRRRVQGGLARVPLPPTATRAYLMLDGRLLYLEQPFQVDLEQADAPSRVTLDATLGAHAVVRWELPPGARERGVSPDEPEGKITIEGSWMFRRGSRARPVNYTFDLSEEGTFEARGIPAGQLYMVAGKIDGLAPYQDMTLRLEAGESRSVDIAFTLGGELRGRVIDADENPIADAEIRTAGGNPMMFRGRGEPEPVKTDSEGRFRLAGARPGELTLEVEAQGWLEKSSDPLPVAEGETLSGVEVVLERGASIAGRVLFEDGQPAQDAKVTVRGTDEGRGPWRPEEELGEGRSDSEGRFEIRGLPDGRFEVVASHGREPQKARRGFPMLEIEDGDGEEGEDEGPSQGWRAAREEIETGTEDLELVLTGLTTVSGIVRDDRGEPLPEFRIVARPAGSSSSPWMNEGRVEQSFEEREDGSFELWGVYPGEWTLEASARDHATTEGSETTVSVPQDQPAQLLLSRAATLAGRVVDPAGGPVEARVIASDGSRQGWWQGGGTRGETEADGSFLLEGLPIGTVTLRAESDDWASSEEQTLELAPSQHVEGLVIELRVGGRVTGEVFDAQGQPEAGRRVTYSENAMGGGVFGNGPAATTDEAGFFAFEHVTPGTWIVSAGPSEERTVEIMSQARDQAAFMEMFSQMDTATVEVVDGGEVHLTLGAEPLVPVRITGRVTRSGEGVDEAQVIAIAEGGSLLKGMKMTTTDSSGAFETTVDRPGAYILTVQGDGRASQIQFPIDVPEVEQHRVTLALPTGGIEGTVQKPDGDPAVGVRMSITAEGESRGMRMGGGGEAQTDADGHYAFEGLWPGAYTVRTGTGNAFGFGLGDDATYGTAILSGVEVEADATTRGADLILAEASVVKGTVHDQAGEAVAGATIFVRDELGRLLSTVSGIVTDAAGKFEYKGVAPGIVTVSARAAERASRDSGPVRVRESDVAEVALTLESGTTLIVEVVDDEGEPVRARVRVWDENDFEVGNMMTMSALQTLFAEGFSTRESRIGPLPPGKYRVEATETDGGGRSTQKPVSLKGQDERKVKLRLRG